MASKKIQLYTDRANTIEASPETSANCVILSDGNNLQKVLDNDLTTPTVVHEETSFKVGVGDVNVSSSVVDGEVGRMVIKGKTYQNILPEPSTPVLTNNKEMFKVNEGLDPNVEIVDGVSKSAILSGQTKLMDELGNECDHPNRPNAVRGAYINASTGEETLSDTSCRTTYIKAPHETFKIRGKNRWKKLAFYDVSKQLIKTLDPALNSYDDYVVNGTLIPSNAEYMRVSGSLSPINSSDVLEPVLEILDANNSSLYNTQLRSCKLPVLTTIGKNFKQGSPVGNFTENNGEYVFTNMSNRNGIRFDVDNTMKIGDTITVSVDCKKNEDFGNNLILLAMNNDVELINKSVPFSMVYERKSLTITIPDNTTHLFLGLGTSLYRNVSFNNIQIEKGSVSTSYEPYKSNILSCELVPMNQSMLEQGTFAESTPPNTRTYEGIKVNSGNLYDTRIRTKGTYKVVKGATYSGQLNNGYGIFICYCKNGLYSAKDKGWIDETNFTFTVPNDCDEMFFALRKTDNSAITPSDYPLIGLKIHQEVVLRSLPNGVKDTLNLMTGEYVQRIGEIVLDETQGFTQDVTSGDFKRFTLHSSFVSNMKVRGAIMCDKFVQIPDANATQEGIATGGSENYRLMLWVESSRLSTPDVAGLQAWLQQNPVTVQYELTTPVVKTVDLSSSGNWEKVVLDGSEDWGADGSYCFCRNLQINSACAFTDSIPVLPTKTNSLPSHASFSGARYFTVLIDGILNDPVKLKQYLSQNPMTVWYQTETHKDSTQIKQPIFFKNGHIIQSSGADSSLIPTLDYQVKTSNSYVMDLMKTGTTYTMKASGVSGTATIGNAGAFTLNTNRTFTSPASQSLFDNKLLVIKGSATDLMIIEGDVTSKTIPYFKGIKSAFEGEDKIEVLSTGKNLFVPIIDETRVGMNNVKLKYNEGIFTVAGNGDGTSEGYSNPLAIKANIEPNTNYTLSYQTDGVYGGVNGTDTVQAFVVGIVDNKTTYICFDVPPTGKSFNTGEYSQIGIRFDLNKSDTTHTFYNIQLEKSVSTATTYEPHKSNSAKIPLLSPLRSLPDGTCDELIIDRMKKKATLIQRVGYVKFDNMDKLSFGDDGGNQYIYLTTDRHIYFANRMERSNAPAIFSHFAYYTDGSLGKKDRGDYAAASNIVFCWCMPTKRDKKERESHLRNLAKQDGVIVQYQLKTPVVTEIDLESFPLVYKDGHIFLNSEIAPVVEIDYNVNQAQQIQANNETLQRHELDILDLDNLIVSFVNAEYNLRLLKFDMELSMMALAE